ncbi:hypothetical protein [Enterococcus faecium]
MRKFEDIRVRIMKSFDRNDPTSHSISPI